MAHAFKALLVLVYIIEFESQFSNTPPIFRDYQAKMFCFCWLDLSGANIMALNSSNLLNSISHPEKADPGLASGDIELSTP